MTYTATPTVFEIHDDDAKMFVARVSMFDEGGATIELKSCFDRTTFDAIVPSLQYALSAMKLDGDK
jgi:hypothetical protein